MLISAIWNPFQTNISKDILLNLGTELLAVSIIFFLINRFFLEDTMDLKEKFESLERKINHTVIANEYLNFHEDINANLFKNAQQIDLLGYCLQRSLRSYLEILEERLLQGVEIRVIILDYKNEPLMNMAEIESENKTADEWKKNIQDSVKYLKEITSNKNLTGTLNVGYLPYSPSFGLTITNKKNTNGLIFVDIYHHKTKSMNATFKLEKNKDEKWFIFFSKQYDLLWSSCRIEKLL